ncbi:DUF5684 domain-containing protein [Demequina sp. NBRC 110056]|uniref:DUF5684 domain-containing protein n=1 Tax=Demequina sp. NBRC 110056 TaxID=1570345 RepID=UPI000A001F92|nr:DUF5684 domain-containing protein [Demequina sp. NBRC 110056]
MPGSELVIGCLVVGAICYVWYAWALSRLFPQIDADGWRGWVPIINEMTLFERGGVATWKVLLYFIPVVNLYALYLRFGAASRIGRPWGRGSGFGVLAVLVPPVWATLLAFGSRADAGVAEERLVAVAGHREVAGGLGQPQLPATPPPGPTPERQRQGGAEPPSRPPAPVEGIEASAEAAPGDAARAAQIDATDGDGSAGDTGVEPGTVLRRRDVDPIEVHNPWSRPPAGSTPKSGRDRTPARSAIALPAWLDAVEGAVDGASGGYSVLDGGADTSTTAAGTTAAAPSDEDGETVVVDRRPQVVWRLVVDDVGPLALTEDSVILGRRPAPTAPGIQALAIPDTTRTLSKAHARLDLADGAWTITDLDSTNGVLLVGAGGEETAIEPGESVALAGRFLLGKVGMNITYESGAS